jgi:hypothetical protein
MRRIAVIALVTVIGTASLVTPPAVAQQGDPDWRIGGEGSAWEGVSRPEPPGTEAVAPPPTGDRIMEPYAVFFNEDYAAVPEVTKFEPEFMVVVVQKGSFALDARDTEPGIVVFPAAGQPIPKMQPKKYERPYYVLTDPLEYVQNPSGGDCTLACPILPGTVVQVKTGDRIVAREGALCVWCLLNSNFTTPDDDLTNSDDQGLLLVYALLTAGASPDSFSWIQDWERNEATAATAYPSESSGTPTAATNSERTMLTWAFNPSTKCDG